jgi:hypothetical protein
LSRRSEPAAREKGMGLRLRSVARLIREDQWVTHSHMTPGSPGAFEVRRDPPHRDDSPRRPAEHESSSRHLFDGSDHSDADSLQRRPSRARSKTPTSMLSALQGTDMDFSRDASNLWSSGVVGLRTCMFLFLSAGVRDRPLMRQRSGGQFPSHQGSTTPPSSHQGEVDQPPSQRSVGGRPLSWLGPSEQPPSRTRWTDR